MWHVRLMIRETRPRARARQRLIVGALVDERGLDDELVAVPAARVGLAVRDRAAQHLLDLARGRALGEREDRPRLGDAAAADLVDDEPRLARRDVDVLRDGLHLGALTASPASSSRPRGRGSGASGANSPSLWPTICSEMKTGTCLLPSWTAIVWPIMSGKTVDERDQVRIICFLPDVVHRLDPARAAAPPRTGPSSSCVTLSASPSRGDGRGRSACRIPCAWSGCACRASARPTG